MGGAPNADAGPPGAAYRFSAFVQTASWVSRFFEAQDCFRTWTSSVLLPLVVSEERREGRRFIKQEEEFDSLRYVVRIDNNLTLPTEPGARDPLSALVYARTLPLAPGYQVSIPVNENGRNIQVHLNVMGLERIQYDGTAVDAMRAEPTLVYKVQTRKPIRITLWLSNDNRHLPLVMEFVADFGTFLAELKSNRPH